MALMPGFNTRSAAEVAHQYAVEQLQQQEINLRAQAQQQQESQFAQQQFMQQQRLSLAQMAQEQEGIRADREFAFKGTGQAVELGIKYDPATKAYRPLVAGDAEFQGWQERKAQKDAEAKMRLEAQRADTVAGRFELAEKLQPLAIATEERGVAREVAKEKRQREFILDAEKRAAAESDRRVAAQWAHEDARQATTMWGQMRLAELNHRLHLVEVKEALGLKGETAEGNQKVKATVEARKAMKEAFDQWQEAETSYVTNRKRILEDMVAETAQKPEELSKPGFLWGRNPLTREEIIAHPSFQRALAPFDAQRQQALRMSAEAQVRYYQAAGLPIPQQVMDTLQVSQPGGPQGGAAPAPAPTVKEAVGAAPQAAPQAGNPPSLLTRAAGQISGIATIPGTAGAQMADAIAGMFSSPQRPARSADGLVKFVEALPPESRQKNTEALAAMYALVFDNPNPQQIGVMDNPVFLKAYASLDDATKNAWARFLDSKGVLGVMKRSQGNAR